MTDDAGTRHHRPGPGYRWAATRAVPLVGSAVFALVAVNYSLWWDPVVHHVDAWWVPGDFWHTYFATDAFVHGHWSAVYGPHTKLVTLPGVLVLLSPAVALAHALSLSIGVPYTPITTPTAWLALEPFDLLAAGAALFSLDAVARRLGVAVSRRAVLVVAEGVALWDVLVWQWHPEDALAVALALWGLLAAFDVRWRRCGWLLGAALAFQPLAVLALVAAVGLAPRRAAVGIVVRAGTPGAVLLAGPLIANPRGTLRSVLDQPNSIGLGHPTHPTPWVHVAPHLGHGVVAAGPARLVAVVVAAVLCWVVCRRTGRNELVVWVVAASFATRSLFEAVLVAYYIWPALAVALVVAARASRERFAAACALSSFATVFALLGWRGEWAWWSVVVACVGAILVAAFPTRGGAAGAGAGTRSDTSGADAPAGPPLAGMGLRLATVGS